MTLTFAINKLIYKEKNYDTLILIYLVIIKINISFTPEEAMLDEMAKSCVTTTC